MTLLIHDYHKYMINFGIIRTMHRIEEIKRITFVSKSLSFTILRWHINDRRAVTCWLFRIIGKLEKHVPTWYSYSSVRAETKVRR